IVGHEALPRQESRQQRALSNEVARGRTTGTCRRTALRPAWVASAFVATMGVLAPDRFAPMRLSRFHLATIKEVPADAEIVSHRRMLRAGMIRKLAAGIYTWLPLGLRVLKKVEAVVREEMDRSGALEVLAPIVVPAELWQESGRYTKYGPELLRFKDRQEREF